MSLFNDADIADFAELMLDCLDAQQKYFRTKGQLALAEAKRLEDKLRKTAEGVLELCRRRRGQRRLSQHRDKQQLSMFDPGVKLPD